MSDLFRGVVPNFPEEYPVPELDLRGAYTRGNTVTAQRVRTLDDYQQRQAGLYERNNPRPEPVSMEQAFAEAERLSQGVGLAANTSPEAAADRATRYAQRMRDNWRQNNPAPEKFDVAKTIEQAEMLRDALGIGTPKEQHWATTLGQHTSNIGHALRTAGGADPQAHADFIKSISAPSQQGTEFINEYVLDAFDDYGKQRSAYQEALSKVGSTKGPSLTEMASQPVVDVQAEAKRIYDEGQEAQNKWVEGRTAAMKVNPPGVEDLVPPPVDPSVKPNNPANPVNVEALKDSIELVLARMSDPDNENIPRGDVDMGYMESMQQILSALNVSLAKEGATPLTNREYTRLRDEVIAATRTYQSGAKNTDPISILSGRN